MASSMTGYLGQMGTNTGKQFRDKVPSGYKAGRMQQYTPEQMELFQQMFSHVSPDSYLSRLAGGDESLFGELEAPALKQFSGLQGNIASRFSGMGTGGRKSSGFQNTLNAASSDFAQQLQSQRQGLQRQAIMDLMGLSNNLLGQRPYEQFLVPKQEKQGFFRSLLGTAPGETINAASKLGGKLGNIGLGAAGGAAFGGPYGSLIGGLGGLFS